jgi:glycosyltransferase involved in cell wall biosynthesis
VLNARRIVAVLPAYKAARTLERVYREIPHEVVDDVLLVDDHSPDDTVQVAARLGIKTFVHRHNLGYGGNQKTCYTEALRAGADVVVMLHPDYQYDPRLITPISGMVASGVYDVVLGSRMLGNTAAAGGMPLYKRLANRGLTAMQNTLLHARLSEYHTGYRAFSREVLETLPLLSNSDDFLFDNQMLAQAIAWGFRVGEVSCPTKYFPEASSINFSRSCVYGLGVLRTSVTYRLWKWKLLRSGTIFADRDDQRLRADAEPDPRRVLLAA